MSSLTFSLNILWRVVRTNGKRKNRNIYVINFTFTCADTTSIYPSSVTGSASPTRTSLVSPQHPLDDTVFKRKKTRNMQRRVVIEERSEVFKGLPVVGEIDELPLDETQRLNVLKSQVEQPS